MRKARSWLGKAAWWIGILAVFVAFRMIQMRGRNILHERLVQYRDTFVRVTAKYDGNSTSGAWLRGTTACLNEALDSRTSSDPKTVLSDCCIKSANEVGGDSSACSDLVKNIQEGSR